MTPDDQNAGPALTREELLSALDAQIKFVSEGQRNEGWTRWAIWGALAAFIWVGIEVVTRSEFALSRAVLAAFGIFVIWGLLECLLGIISPTSSVDVGPPRFREVTGWISALRPELTALALRHLLIIVALLFFHYPGQRLFLIYVGLALVSDVVVLLYGMTSVALPTKFSMGAAIGTVALLKMAWLVAAGISVASLIKKDLSTFTQQDVRFALLLNAGSYLLIRLATTTSSGHLLSELTEIRQHVAFVRLSVADAIRQTEGLLTGLKVAEVLNPLVETTLKEAQELDQTMNRSVELLGQIRVQISTLRDNLSAQAHESDDFADALHLLDELESEVRRVSAKLKALTRVRNQFLLRAVVIAVYSRESRSEMREPSKKVQDAFTQANKKVADLRQRHASAKEDVNQIMKGCRPE